MLTVDGVDKPLAEWTLTDAKRMCENHWRKNGECGACPLHITKSDICSSSPVRWDLSEKPNFTGQEIQDAKVLQRLFGYGAIYRNENSSGPRAIFRYGSNCMYLQESLFPSVKSGKEYRLEDIIGEAGDEDA